MKPGEECPPGTTLVRVGSCQAPEFPPPSIVDYRPTSSLEVAEHPVPRAKFPVVDIHSHTGPTPATIASLISQMDALNIRVLNNLSGGSGDALTQRVTYIKSTPYANRFTVFANGLNQFRGVAAGLRPEGRGAARVGCEERRHRFQDFQRDRHGHDEGGRHPAEDQRSRARADLGDGGAAEHPGHHPYSRASGVLQAARYAQRALARARAVRQPPAIPRACLVRDRSARNATICSRSIRRRASSRRTSDGTRNDLGRAAKLLDAHPNVVLELAAILYDLGRQPRAAHDFFVKYQDRILFGKDTYAPTEFPYYWRVLETRDEYFDYYRDYHAFWKMYGMELPDAVLRKVYYQNARRVTPGLPQIANP